MAVGTADLFFKKGSKGPQNILYTYCKNEKNVIKFIYQRVKEKENVKPKFT